MDPNFIKNHMTTIMIISAAAVITIGIIVGIAGMLISRRRKAARVNWFRGAYSLWTGGEDSGAWDGDEARKCLNSWYSASNADKFRRVIKDLRKGQTGNKAWDLVRALDLLRIGAAADFIDEEECWNESAKVGTELQRLYKSWEKLAEAFEEGMNSWQNSSGITDPKQLGRVQRNLPVLRKEIWPLASYGMRLTTED